MAHQGRVAMLYTTLFGVRGISFTVRLPSAFTIGGPRGGQSHYLSAYASLFAGEDPKKSIVEAGMMFVPAGSGPNSGDWSIVLNPVDKLGATLRNGKWAYDGQRSVPATKKALRQATNFELMLIEPERGAFKIDGAPFHDGLFYPAPTKGESSSVRFDKGVNARIAIGYNDEGLPAVSVRDFIIEITGLYRKDEQTGAFGWVLPGPLTRRDETGLAKFGVGKITLDYGVPRPPWLGFEPTPSPRQTFGFWNE